MYATQRSFMDDYTNYKPRKGKSQETQKYKSAVSHTYTATEKFKYYLFKLYSIARDDDEGNLALSLSSSRGQLREIESLYWILGEALRFHKDRGGKEDPSRSLYLSEKRYNELNGINVSKSDRLADQQELFRAGINKNENLSKETTRIGVASATALAESPLDTGL